MRCLKSALWSRPNSRLLTSSCSALAQRLDGEPELLLRLVHRPVVEVGDPRVDPQDGLGNGEFVLARFQFVVGEGAGQRVLADVAGRHRDLRLTAMVLALMGA